MGIPLELEEWVGGHWHRFITRHAEAGFPQAEVTLESMARSLAMLFHAFGGESGMALEGAPARQLLLRRGWLQRIAGTCRQMTVAWRSQDCLRLPERLAVYPEAGLNRELYRWLALLAAGADGISHWGRDNQRWTARLLADYPALRPRYRQLVEAHIALRPAMDSLPRLEAGLEDCIRHALLEPGSVEHFPRAERAPWPVPLWLYPEGQLQAPQSTHLLDGEPGGGAPRIDQGRGPSKRAERVADSQGKDGLLLFRLENLFSWSEYLDLDRCGDDEEDQDAARVAEDLDHLALSRHRTHKGGGLRLDLDLPAAELDDVPLGPGLRLPEWDYHRQCLLADHVSLQQMLPRDAVPAGLPERLRPMSRRLRRQFEQLRDGRQRRRQRPQGEELDLDAWLDFQVERRHAICAEPGFFVERLPLRRDLACLLLADLSMSTETYLDNERRVIDTIVDSLLLFGEALDALGDPFALYGFSSLRRQQVRMQVLKPFAERYGDAVRGRILALRPGYYTRMGAAIRQATRLLGGRSEKRRLLLLVSDGKPNDLDRYEGRYGVEDTRQAVLEARRQNLLPFCITIDREAGQYLPYMFGANGYALVARPEQLAVRLLHLYRQLRR
ncbi:nitric oxide reductase activation protein NorD [Pseudomonas jinjuensis]|uniref:Nitric oxide reductase NorD protein n=1 Tax=Pseudomonas jinjuensis TaxID=198616 RepID=A0A1H0IU15_9PSED|nr:VWA domain-containing protein [Pseudomonas jinjuensis]SDO34966.1 nitric oxide reductase NorD protein [Pseudomonas jinjuensis]